MSKDDLWDPNYRSLRDAIAVVSEHFTVKGAETKLGDMLASGDPPSILQRMDGTREWLPAWKEKITLSITWYIHSPRKLVRDDDIEIVRGGLETLNPNLVLVWWPYIEKLCGLVQPEPVGQPEREPVKTKPKRRRRRKKAQPKQPAPVVSVVPVEPEIEQPTPVEPEKPPTLRQKMIVAILRAEFGDNFTTDDIRGKTKVVAVRWDAERKAPLGDESRRNDYSMPSYKTVEYTIKDYLRRPSAYLEVLPKKK
jgi:hypothetical protein